MNRNSSRQADAEPAKVLHLGMNWLPEAGGADRYFHGLVTQLGAMRTPQAGIAFGPEGESSWLGGQICCIERSDAPLPKRLWAVRTEARRQLHGHSHHMLIATHFALYGLPILNQLRKIPHVLHFHGPWSLEASREGQRQPAVYFKQKIEQAVYATADRAIVLSNAFKNILCDRYRIAPSIVKVIPGGIDATRFNCDLSSIEARQRLGLPADRPIILCVRRLSRRMGIENLIDATIRLRVRHPDVLVLIAGKGPLANELKKRVADRGLEDHVRLLGFVPDEDLPLAYRAADLTVVPTQALEGFGLITLESLAAGTPCLVTPVGGLPEAVSGLSKDLIFGGTDETDIAEGLSDALSGALPLPNAGLCQSYVRENFDWPIIARQVLEVYKEATEAFHNR